MTLISDRRAATIARKHSTTPTSVEREALLAMSTKEWKSSIRRNKLNRFMQANVRRSLLFECTERHVDCAMTLHGLCREKVRDKIKELCNEETG